MTDYEVVPYTGEAIELATATDEQLAQLLDQVKEWKRAQLAAFEGAVRDEILHRMDTLAKGGVPGAWTLRAGRYKLTGSSPGQTEYDLSAVRAVLKSLVKTGDITDDAAKKVIVPKGERVSVSAVNQLRKLGGLVDETLGACKVPVTRPRSVSVTVEI
jgi:hypothetical protein